MDDYIDQNCDLSVELQNFYSDDKNLLANDLKDDIIKEANRSTSRFKKLKISFKENDSIIKNSNSAINQNLRGDKLFSQKIGTVEGNFDNCKAFICGMDWWTTDGDLEKNFEIYGIKDIDFGIDKINGKSKGWATFEVRDKKTLNESIRKFNGQTFFARKVFLCPADESSIAELLCREQLNYHLNDFREAWESEEIKQNLCFSRISNNFRHKMDLLHTRMIRHGITTGIISDSELEKIAFFGRNRFSNRSHGYN